MLGGHHRQAGELGDLSRMYVAGVCQLMRDLGDMTDAR